MTADVRVSSLAYGGSLVGEVVRGPAGSEGKRAFVPFAAPSELVRIGILKEEQRFLEGELLEILERSPSRIPAPCPYFARCGGCSLQHLPISEQRELKRSMIETTLHRQGGISPKCGVSIAPAPLPEYAYRRRVTLQLSRDGHIGFFRPRSGEVVPIEGCLIASERINAAIPKLAEAAAALGERFGAVAVEEREGEELSILLHPRDGAPNTGPVPAELLLHFPRASIRGSLDSDDDDGAGHFSQVNATANRELVRLVLDRVTANQVTDLYAGSGNFSLPLAASGKAVTAVELDGALTALGAKSAQAAGLETRLRFVESSCEQFMKRNHPTEGVLLDPPRSGAKEVAQRLEPARTREIVYVSCNLPSLTRDLQIFSSRGYEIVETVFVDMFPQTHHVETVTVLRTKR